MADMANPQAQTTDTSSKPQWPRSHLNKRIVEALVATGRTHPKGMQPAILRSYFPNGQSMFLTAPPNTGTKLAINTIALQTALQQRAAIRKEVGDTVASFVADKQQSVSPSTKSSPENYKFPSVVIICKTLEQVETARVQLSQLNEVGDLCLNIETGSGTYSTKKLAPICKAANGTKHEVSGAASVKFAAFHKPVDILIGTPNSIHDMIAQTKSAEHGPANDRKEGTLQPKVAEFKHLCLSIWIDGKGLAMMDNYALVSPENATNMNSHLTVIKREIVNRGTSCVNLIVTDPLSEQLRADFVELLGQVKATPTLQWNDADALDVQRIKSAGDLKSQVWGLATAMRNMVKNVDPKDVRMSKFVVLLAKDTDDDTVRVLFGDEMTPEATSSILTIDSDQTKSKAFPEDKYQVAKEWREQQATKQKAIEPEATDEPNSDQKAAAAPGQGSKKKKNGTKQPASAPDNRPVGIVIYGSINTFDSNPEGFLRKRLENSTTRTKKNFHDVLFGHKPKHQWPIRQVVRVLDGNGLSVPAWMRAIAVAFDADEVKCKTGREKKKGAAQISGGEIATMSGGLDGLSDDNAKAEAEAKKKGAVEGGDTGGAGDAGGEADGTNTTVGREAPTARAGTNASGGLHVPQNSSLGPEQIAPGEDIDNEQIEQTEQTPGSITSLEEVSHPAGNDGGVIKDLKKDSGRPSPIEPVPLINDTPMPEEEQVKPEDGESQKTGEPVNKNVSGEVQK